jgi:hypothetical protein
MSSLDSRLDSAAQTWRPQVGDKIVGTLVAIGTRASQFGDQPYPLLTLATDKGEVIIHAFHSVLKNELAAQRPQVGDRIGIVFNGKPDGKRYEHYRLVVERDAPQQELDWNTVAPETADTSAEVADDIPF